MAEKIKLDLIDDNPYNPRKHYPQAKMQAEFDRNDKIKAEYLEWEKDCLNRHKLTEEELRVYLVNAVIV